ncbi:MAG: DUF2281 domain-containing protein [Acidobacteria bacterium]|jgi:hypothetical protein|nr:DUF2281 domain-containing protein [Acidobacteriota bacterium]
MSIEQVVVENFRALAFDQQREVLDFVEFLHEKNNRKKPLKSSLGICSDLSVSISAEEIDEARSEMWKNFPREKFFIEETEK